MVDARTLLGANENGSAERIDPFTATREGDKIYGRGTTDCIGHVCMLTELFTSVWPLFYAQ